MLPEQTRARLLTVLVRPLIGMTVSTYAAAWSRARPAASFMASNCSSDANCTRKPRELGGV